MEWQVNIAKNGEANLVLNGIHLYSQYRPKYSVKKWVEAEIDKFAHSYLLIGLGLGYHLQLLKDLVKEKPITVLCFEKQEFEIFKTYYNNEWWDQPNIEICYTLNPEKITRDTQILLPNVWIKAIGEQHNLFSLLESIKINQQSYKKFGLLMHENFTKNISEMNVASYPKKERQFACLVAAGPSLDETIQLLKSIRGKVDIYAVGSALKPLLKGNIIPNAVIISDPQDAILKQFEGIIYTNNLFYLSTANYKTVNAHAGPRFIMFQEGYNEAEIKAKELNYPLFETGGSVSTVTYSLIEFLGYKNLILFGLDLGYAHNQTHANYSPSDKLQEIDSSLKVIANDGTEISTAQNLKVYLNWFNRRLQDSKLKIYNTSKKGAKIADVPFFGKEELIGVLGI